MAFIEYVVDEEIPEEDRVADRDNIIRIHGVHSRLLRLHHDLYRELMYGPGPLSRVQREMVAVVASAHNRCRY